MSEMYDEDDNSNDQNSGSQESRDMRNLRRKAEKADELAAKLAAMERKEAFRDAGIDLSDPKSSYFMKGYDGEISPDAIRKAAEEAGFIAPPPPRTPEQEQNLTAEQQFVAASQGATPMDAATEDQIRSEMVAALNSGGIPAMLDKAREYGAVISDDLM